MNLANKITLARIGLTPLFLLFLLTDFAPHSLLIALGIFLLAAASDGLDGYIARSRNQITDFGKFIDPLADKLLISAALVGLIQLGGMNAAAAFVVLAREFMVTGLRTVAMRSGKVIAATFSGKLKMVVQIIAVAIAILALEFQTAAPWLSVAAVCAVWCMVIITTYSGIDYLVRNWAAVDYRK